MALMTAATGYFVAVILSFDTLAMRSNISCSEPGAPANCDNLRLES
jgi:hypothetical protein